jgi:SAM-dependent methyltransferase
VTEIKLTQRALRAWAGTDRLSALQPERLARLPITMASTELALFVAGVDVPILDPADDDMFCERRGELTHARVALLPTAHGIVICDRHDARVDDPLRVCWPDDSSYHLARAIPPGRRASWLDLGCGSAFAMLERPELASRIVGVEINPRAVRDARLGAKLSGVERLELFEADATQLDPGERFELVTCNPPMPAHEASGPRWRVADDATVRRMIARAGELVAPGGLVVVHAALGAIDELPGESILVAYTPEDERQFGVMWWSPDGEPRKSLGRRALTPDRPHLDSADRDAARAGTLPWH